MFIDLSKFTDNEGRPLPEILHLPADNDFSDPDRYNSEIPNSMLVATFYRIFTVLNDCISNDYLLSLLHNIEISPEFLRTLYNKTDDSADAIPNGNCYWMATR